MRWSSRDKAVVIGSADGRNACPEPCRRVPRHATDPARLRRQRGENVEKGLAVACPPTTRLFTALALPDNVRARLTSFVARLHRRCADGLRFVACEQLHVTTKFLGERDDVAANAQSLARLPRRGAVDVVVGGLGFFPDGRRPRVFCVGVVRTPSLVALAEDTELRLAVDCGIAPDARAFSPYLTLARLRSPPEVRALRAAIAFVNDHARFGRWQATTFSLVGSDVDDGIHRHTTLATFSVVPDTTVPTALRSAGA